MKSEIDIVFAILRAALQGEKAELPVMETQQWWSVFKLMQRNHVAALTADVAAASTMPREVKLPWLAERDKAVRWYRYQLDVQNDIIGIMRKHGIETLVLKGTHTAQYYPQPELREFGDLDLYFYDKHAEADRVASEMLQVTVGNDAHHHSKYNFRGVTVESHYDFLNTHYPPSNRRYEALLKKLAPTPTFEVLFLIRHMAGHFAASRITLRDLVDWALTCQTLHDKVDWQLVEKTINDYGMTEFVATLNTIVHNRLGGLLKLPDSLSCCPVDSLSQKLERDIVYGSIDDHANDGIDRLVWKLRRWRALAWKRRMVFSDSPMALWFSSLSSHAEKPQSFLHKQ